MKIEFCCQDIETIMPFFEFDEMGDWFFKIGGRHFCFVYCPYCGSPIDLIPGKENTSQKQHREISGTMTITAPRIVIEESEDTNEENL